MKSEWTNEDQNKALYDGWGIFNNSDHGVRIERYDESEKFKSDAMAIAYVAWRASCGHQLERKAVNYLAGHYFLVPEKVKG